MEDRLYAKLYELEDEHWWFRGRREVIAALLAQAELEPGARILDAGCGTGRNLEDLAPRGEVRGVDMSADAVAFCERRGVGPVDQAPLEQLPYEDGAFDVVLACDVIEHIPDDERALRELRRVTADDGRLLVTVPAYRWLWSGHDESHHHQRRYRRSELLERVRAAGWEPTLTTYFNTLLLPPIAAARTLERLRRRPPRATTDYERTPGWLNTALAYPMRVEARAIGRGTRLRAGVSIGLVCVTT